MAEDNGRLNYSSYIDNSELQNSAEESKRILASIGDEAQSQGARLDRSMNVDLSGLRAVSKEASELFSHLAGEFDISTVEAKIAALEEVIKTDEEVIKDLSQTFDDLGAKAKEAFAAGNFEEFDNLTIQMENTAAQIREVSDDADNCRVVLESLKVSAGDTSVAVDQLSQSEEKHSNIMVTLLGGQEQYNAIVGQLPQGLQSAIKGLEGMTGAAKAFIATPLGAILAAIILALKALKTWFDSSVEGQMAFAKVSGYVSGVLGQLKEIVIAVGKALYTAFTNPKEAVVKLWNVIKENIVNRFKALGDMASSLGKILKAAFTFDTDGIKAGVKELGESFLQFGTGVDNLTGKIGAWASGVHDAAKATADISQASRQLEIDVAEWGKQKEKLEQIKAEARMKMYDTSLSQSEREAALNAYKNALNQQVEAEREFADRRIDLQKRTMSLTTNSIEDENKLRELEAARARVDTQAQNELAMLQRRANSITNPKGGNSAAAAEQNAEKQRASELLSLQDKNRQAEIDAMEEGLQKKLAQIRFNYDREIAEITEQEKKWREAQNGELTETQQTAITTARDATDKKQKADTALVTQEDIDKALQGIQTYNQRRLEIEEEYAERRKALYVDGDETKGLKEGVDTGNLDELKRQEDEALSAVDEQFASRDETYQAWCEEIANLSLKQLTEVLARAQEELKALVAAGEKDSAKLSAARAKVSKAQAAVNKSSAQNSTAPGKRTIKEWEDLYSTLNECNNSFKEIGDTVGGVAGDIIKTVGGITGSTLQMVNGIVTLVTSSSATMVGTAAAGATAISTMEKASVILTVISAAMSTAMAIVNLFNSDQAKQEHIEALQGQIDQLQWEIDNANLVRLQQENGKATDSVAQAYSRYRNELAATAKQLYQQGGMYAYLTQIQTTTPKVMQKNAENLAKAYANVGYAADKALGADKYKSAQDTLKNYAQQQLLIQEQIETERSKKKSDDDAIKVYEQKIEEIGGKAVKLINDLVEDIIGGGATDIAEELSDAFFDAFQDGEDYAEAWGDKVNDIVADVIKRMLVSQFLEAPLGKIFDKYKAKWFKDGNFAGPQAVIDSMSGFAADLNAVGDDFRVIWDSLPDSVKDMFTVTGDATREASQEGIATASQESVDELNGRMTAVQGHTYSISENTKLLVANTASILQSVLNIEANTDRLAAVETNIKEVRNTLNDLALKGIKIK